MLPLDLLCCPVTRTPLRLEGDVLLGEGGLRYGIDPNGVPHFAETDLSPEARAILALDDPLNDDPLKEDERRAMVNEPETAMPGQQVAVARRAVDVADEGVVPDDGRRVALRRPRQEPHFPQHDHPHVERRRTDR